MTQSVPRHAEVMSQHVKFKTSQYNQAGSMANVGQKDRGYIGHQLGLGLERVPLAKRVPTYVSLFSLVAVGISGTFNLIHSGLGLGLGSRV